MFLQSSVRLDSERKCTWEPVKGAHNTFELEQLHNCFTRWAHRAKKHRPQCWLHTILLHTLKSASCFVRDTLILLPFFKAKFSRAVFWPNCTRDVYWSVPNIAWKWAPSAFQKILCDLETSIMLLFTACIHSIIFFWQFKVYEIYETIDYKLLVWSWPIFTWQECWTGKGSKPL